MHRSEALTRYTQNCKDFSKKAGENIVTQIKKTVEKIVAVVKKVVVCMEDNEIILRFVCSVQEPLHVHFGFVTSIADVYHNIY